MRAATHGPGQAQPLVSRAIYRLWQPLLVLYSRDFAVGGLTRARSGNWVGHLIGEVFGIDSREDSGKARVKAIIMD